MPNQIVVAGALILDSALLVAQRARPPELAGLWGLPGGKVSPGESDDAALARELCEELGVEVAVGNRLGGDVALSETTTLRAYRVTQTGGDLHPNDHRALRWVTVDELDGLPWVPADRAWLTDLTRALHRDGVVVRPAAERDRGGIATVIAHAYRREFSILTRDMEKIAGALENAVEVNRFFVAEQRGDVVGAIACTDCTGRAMRVDNANFRRHLGLVRGELGARISSRSSCLLEYPATTGYIEFVAVSERLGAEASPPSWSRASSPRLRTRSSSWKWSAPTRRRGTATPTSGSPRSSA